LKVGEVEGEISIEGVGGQVELARASEGTKIEGVNGHVMAKVSGLKEQGLKIEGVNGRVTLQLVGDLNADLEINGVNGRIETELPNFKPRGEQERGHVEGQIGKGGSPLEISSINGRVWVGPVGKAINLDQPGVVVTSPVGTATTVPPGRVIQDKKPIKKVISDGVTAKKQ
jgi:DUF4097 and DUF4098 domain-containing protein YvlB